MTSMRSHPVPTFPQFQFLHAKTVGFVVQISLAQSQWRVSATQVPGLGDQKAGQSDFLADCSSPEWYEAA
jgi:hypothetical protein